MARFTGYRCDYQPCSRAAEGSGPEGQGVPDGWVMVQVHTAADISVEPMLLCGSKCLLTVAKERVAADPGKRSRAGAGGLARGHRNGGHADEPRDGCPLCEAETAPTNGTAPTVGASR